MLPLTPDGEFADGLRKGRRAAVELDRRLRQDMRFEALCSGGPELDIVVWRAAAPSAERASELANKIFARCAELDLHLALVQLPQSWFDLGTSVQSDAQTVTCLRSVLMKPEHEAWLDPIWDRLSAAAGEGL
jgi:hypothetical protein